MAESADSLGTSPDARFISARIRSEISRNLGFYASHALIKPPRLTAQPVQKRRSRPVACNYQGTNWAVNEIGVSAARNCVNAYIGPTCHRTKKVSGMFWLPIVNQPLSEVGRFQSDFFGF